MKQIKEKLYVYELKELPKKWRPTEEEPTLLLGNARFQSSKKTVFLIWGIILLTLGSLIAGPTLLRFFQEGPVQINVNGELSTLGWHNLKLTIIVLGFLLLFPMLGILGLWLAARIQSTTPILVWLAEKGLFIKENEEDHCFPWDTFQKDNIEFNTDGSVILPLKNGGEVEVGRLSSPSIFFQLLDRNISGNTDLVQFHRYEEKLKVTHNEGHFIRVIISQLLRFLKFSSIALGLMLFGSIPLIFVTVVHFKDDGSTFFKFFEYGPILILAGFIFAALKEIFKSISIEYKSDRPGKLWQVLSFRQNVAVVIYTIVFFIYYLWLPQQTFGEDFFFDRLIYFFFGIILFFISFLLMMYLSTRVQKYLHPVLALREFGTKGISGQWSQVFSPREQGPLEHDDLFLHQIGSLFSIKPVYAYYDRRLDPDGFQDSNAQFFLQSKKWLDYVTSCAKIAQAVIIVPATSESLLMEMNMLRDEGLLHKTFVLMPPENKNSQTIQTQWEEIRNTLFKKNYALPAYEAGGMVYLPNSDYSIHKNWKLHFSIRNLFFIPVFRRWKLSKKSIHDQIYDGAAALAAATAKE